MSKSGGSFFAFLFGAITGGVLGILYAPDKGINTRDKLTYQLDKLKKQLEAFLHEVVDGEIAFENQAKDKSEKIVKETRDKAEQLLDDVDGLINKIKKE